MEERRRPSVGVLFCGIDWREDRPRLRNRFLKTRVIMLRAQSAEHRVCFFFYFNLENTSGGGHVLHPASAPLRYDPPVSGSLRDRHR